MSAFICFGIKITTFEEIKLINSKKRGDEHTQSLSEQKEEVLYFSKL